MHFSTDNLEASHDLLIDSTVVSTAALPRDSTSDLKLAEEHSSEPRSRLTRSNTVQTTIPASSASELLSGSSKECSKHVEGLVRVLSNALSNFNSLPASSIWRTRLSDFWIANYGAFCIVVSQIFGCGMYTATRILETPSPHGEAMGPFQILFIRQLITSLLCMLWALWFKSVPHFPFGPPGTIRLLLMSRAFFGFFGVFGMYFGLLYLPLSEATVLTFLTPIGTCYAMSWLLPGETFNGRQQIAGFVSLLGVVLVARPASLFEHDGNDLVISGPAVVAPGSNDLPQGPPQPTPAQHVLAIGIGLLGVMGSIASWTSMRRIGNRVHPFITTFYFSVSCALMSLMALLIMPGVQFRFPSNFVELGLLSTVSICGFIMQWLLAVGLAYGAAPAPAPSKDSTNRLTQDLETQTCPDEIRDPGSVINTTYAADSVDHQPRSTTTQTSVKTSGAKATSMTYTQIVFALAADKVVFGVTPGLWSWVGSALILGGAIYVAVEGAKSQTQSPATYDRDERPQAEEEEDVELLRDHIIHSKSW